MFNPFPEVVIPIEIQIKEAKSGIETHPVIVEATIRKCSKVLKKVLFTYQFISIYFFN